MACRLNEFLLSTLNPFSSFQFSFFFLSPLTVSVATAETASDNGAVADQIPTPTKIKPTTTRPTVIMPVELEEGRPRSRALSFMFLLFFKFIPRRIGKKVLNVVSYVFTISSYVFAGVRVSLVDDAPLILS